MGKQLNKIEKRRRRKLYLRRKNARDKEKLAAGPIKSRKSPSKAKDGDSASTKKPAAKKKAAKKKAPARKKAAAKKRAAETPVEGAPGETPAETPPQNESAPDSADS